VLQLVAQADKLGPVAAAFIILVLVACFVLPRWREQKVRERLALHPWKGKEVRFVFKPDYLEVHAPAGSKAIDLQCITRASRDDRGILVFGPQIGVLFIPSVGFESADVRDSAFDLLRAALNKKG
jgi:hypothetical protein